MKKQQGSAFRQEKIKELLSKELISDQHTIVEFLKSHYGIVANQTIVSRDLRKLGVVKKMVRGVLAYEIPTLDVRIEILKLGVVDVVYNEANIVIKTFPGLAAFVGDYLDSCIDIEIAGCIAGENVVFVAPRSLSEIKKTCLDICEKLQFIPK